MNKLKLTKRFYDHIKQKGVHTAVNGLPPIIGQRSLTKEEADSFQIPEIISETKTHYYIDASDKNIDVLYFAAKDLGSYNSGVAHGAKSAYRAIDKIRKFLESGSSFKSLTELKYFFGLLIKDPSFWSQGRLKGYPKNEISPLEIRRSADKSYFYFERTYIVLTPSERESLEKHWDSEERLHPRRILKRKISEITESDLENAVAEFYHRA